MSKLLEVFGKAITINTADLIWYWLSAKIHNENSTNCDYPKDYYELNNIIDQLAQMDLEQAELSIKEYIQDNPECCMGRMLAACVKFHKNDIKSALIQLQSVYMREPNNTMALYAMGTCYERAGNIPQAMEFYQDCIKFKHYLQLPRQRMAAIYLKSGQLNKAIEQYEFIKTEYPDDISAMILLGYLNISNLNYDTAQDVFNSAIISHPDNFQTDQEHDDICMLIKENKFDSAIENVDYLMEQLGDMPDLYVKKGDIYVAAKNDGLAIVNYEKALQIQPNYMEACIKLGTAHLKMHRYTLAAENFNKAVEINDEVVDAYVGLAISQLLSGNYSCAEKTISFAGSIQQNSTILFAETATLNYQSALSEGFSIDGIDKDALIDSVIQAHRSLAKDNPKSADAYYKLGMLQMGTSRLKEAQEQFKLALQINPTHHRSRTKLAICQYELGDHKESLETIITPDILDSDLLTLHYKTALLFADRPKFVQAVENLDRHTKVNYKDSDTLTGIQVVLENLGLIDRASTSWERLCYTTNHALAFPE